MEMKEQDLIDRVADEVMGRIALGKKVNALADQAIKRMRIGAVDKSLPLESRPASQMASGAPRKLILRSKLSPGDILMLTAAVRDIHLTYPGQFVTDVKTSCKQLWENNPYITELPPDDADVSVIDCKYPLVHRSNKVPYHFIHAYRKFLNKTLDIQIEAHSFMGDVHLSEDERTRPSQLEETSGRKSLTYWIIVSGGKNDFTTKWWDPSRYQQVVDHFRGRITFVQVGQEKHVHPPLDGVINLVGKTDLRQLISLMYHAEGVVCGVTMLMHLAAAVECKPGHPRNRPCVVIAGGREPSQWEAYPHHQYLHTNGALPCCDKGGCWKSRIAPLGDNSQADFNLCTRPISSASGMLLPQCMDMISVEDVVRKIELYLNFDTQVAPPNKRGASAQDNLPPFTDADESGGATVGTNGRHAGGVL